MAHCIWQIHVLHTDVALVYRCSAGLTMWTFVGSLHECALCC